MEVKHDTQSSVALGKDLIPLDLSFLFCKLEEQTCGVTMALCSFQILVESRPLSLDF